MLSLFVLASSDASLVVVGRHMEWSHDPGYCPSEDPPHLPVHHLLQSRQCRQYVSSLINEQHLRNEDDILCTLFFPWFVNEAQSL